MKMDQITHHSVSTGFKDSVGFSIDSEDMPFIASLLRNNYKDTILAAIREIFCNAVDAMVEAGKNPALIEVSLPTNLSLEFKIRDFGNGLSRDSLLNLYSKFGKSTKRNSNNLIGGLGIGKAAPLAYSELMTVVSVHDGIRTVGMVHINEDNHTYVTLADSVPTEEPSGVEVSFAVKKNDVETFARKTAYFLTFFPFSPKINNFANDIGRPRLSTSFEKKEEEFSWKIGGYNDTHYTCEFAKFGAVMGNVFYPIDFGTIGLPANLAYLKNINGSVVFFIPIGAAKLHHSREGFEYTSSTKIYFTSLFQSIHNFIQNEAKTTVDNEKCIIAAKRKAKNVENIFGYNSLNSYLWNGINLSDYRVRTDVCVDDTSSPQFLNPNTNKMEHPKINLREICSMKVQRLGSRSKEKINSISRFEEEYVFLIVDELKYRKNYVSAAETYLNSIGGKNIVVVHFDTEFAKKSFLEENKFDFVGCKFFYSQLPWHNIITQTKKVSAKSKSGPRTMKLIDVDGRQRNVAKADLNSVEIKPYCISTQQGVENVIGGSYDFCRIFRTKLFIIQKHVVTEEWKQKHKDFVLWSEFIKDKFNSASKEVKKIIFDTYDYFGMSGDLRNLCSNFQFMKDELCDLDVNFKNLFEFPVVIQNKLEIGTKDNFFVKNYHYFFPFIQESFPKYSDFVKDVQKKYKLLSLIAREIVYYRFNEDDKNGILDYVKSIQSSTAAV